MLNTSEPEESKHRTHLESSNFIAYLSEENLVLYNSSEEQYEIYSLRDMTRRNIMSNENKFVIPTLSGPWRTFNQTNIEIVSKTAILCRIEPSDENCRWVLYDFWAFDE